MNHKIPFVFLLILPLIFGSCKKDDEQGKLTLRFAFSNNGKEFVSDSMIYENAAGNKYEVNEIKFFISDLQLVRNGSVAVTISKPHYVEHSLPNTLTWRIDETMETGHYDALRFRFGLTGKQNQSHYFVNPPENNMAWPDVLGGGYHYMMINGKWLKEGFPTPFNFHLGIGQTYDTDHNITGFIDNTFIVTVPGSAFEIVSDGTMLTLYMDVDKWFSACQPFDFDVIGGSIMTNQEAQNIAKTNGPHVFSLKK